MNGIVFVLKTHSLKQVEIIKQKLEDSGIPCYHHSGGMNCSSIYHSINIPGFKIYVRKCDLKNAKHILHENNFQNEFNPFLLAFILLLILIVFAFLKIQ